MKTAGSFKLLVLQHHHLFVLSKCSRSGRDYYKQNWVTDNNIIYPHQAGFRRGQGTIDHCQTLYQLAHSAMNGPIRSVC